MKIKTLLTIFLLFICFPVLSIELVVQNGHGSSIKGLTFNQDNKTIVSHDKNKKIIFWDIKSGKQFNSINLNKNDNVRKILFSKDGKNFVVAFENKIRIYNKNGKKLIKEKKLSKKTKIQALRISNNNKYLAVSYSLNSNTDIRVNVFDYKNLKLISSFNTFSFSIDFNISQDKLITNNKTLNLLTKEVTNNFLYCNRFSIISERNIFCIEKNSRIIDYHDIDKKKTVFNTNMNIDSMANSLNNRSFIESRYKLNKELFAYSNKNNRSLNILNIKTKRNILIDSNQTDINAHKHTISSLSLSSDNNYLAYSMDNKISLIEIKSKRKLKTFSGKTDSIENFAFRSDNKFLATYEKETKKIYSWDLYFAKKSIPSRQNNILFRSNKISFKKKKSLKVGKANIINNLLPNGEYSYISKNGKIKVRFFKDPFSEINLYDFETLRLKKIKVPYENIKKIYDYGKDKLVIIGKYNNIFIYNFSTEKIKRLSYSNDYKFLDHILSTKYRDVLLVYSSLQNIKQFVTLINLKTDKKIVIDNVNIGDPKEIFIVNKKEFITIDKIGSIKKWDIKTAKLLASKKVFNKKNKLRKVKKIANNHLLIKTSNNSFIFDTKKFKTKKIFNQEKFKILGVDKKFKYIIFSKNNKIDLYNYKSKKLIKNFELNNIESVGFSGNKLALIDQQKLKVYDINKKKYIFEHKIFIDLKTVSRSIKFKNNKIIIINSNSYNKKNFEIFDLNKRKKVSSSKHKLYETKNYIFDTKHVILNSKPFSYNYISIVKNKKRNKFKINSLEIEDIKLADNNNSVILDYENGNSYKYSLSGKLLSKSNSNKSLNQDSIYINQINKGFKDAKTNLLEIRNKNKNLIYKIESDKNNIQSSELSKNKRYLVYYLGNKKSGIDSNEIESNQKKPIKIVDLKTKKIVQEYSGLPPVKFADNKRILFKKDNVLKMINFKKNKEIATFISVLPDNFKLSLKQSNNDYLIYTPDNYYMGSSNGVTSVAFVNKSTIYPFEEFDLKYNRPDIVLERIGIKNRKVINLYHKLYKKRLEKYNFNEKIFSNNFELPIISTNKNQIPVISKNKFINLDLFLKDNNHPLKNINIYVNDVPVFGIEGLKVKGYKKKVSKKIKLELSNGKNKIQVSVKNKIGIESLKETFEINYIGKKNKPNLYLVSVGVSKYKDQRFNLRYANKDALDVKNFFSKNKSMFNNVFNITLTDQKATKKNILGTKNFLSKTSVDDYVIFFLAGHGMLDNNFNYYFGNYDINFDIPNKNGLSFSELEDVLDEINSRNKLILIDTCNSGNLDIDYLSKLKNSNVKVSSNFRGIKIQNKSKLYKSFDIYNSIFPNLNRGSGSEIISSSAGVELSYETQKLKNGVFTYSFLEAMKKDIEYYNNFGEKDLTFRADYNNDSIVSISELKRYLTRRVRKLTDGLQNPSIRRENYELDLELHK